MSDLEPLSDLARELLDEERSAIGAQPELSGRVMAKLEAALGPTLGFGADGAGGGHHGGEGGAGPGGAAPPAAGAGAGAALGGAKLAAVIATTFAVGTGAGVAVDRTLAVPAPTVTVYLPAAPAPSTTMIPVGITGASASASTSAAPTAAPRATATTATAATTSDPKSDLARERELIDAARAGVARGHAEAALSAVTRHEREFPQGQLREEREGLRILALAAQGRTTEARTFAARFRKSYPQSVLLPQIDAALGVP